MLRPAIGKQRDGGVHVEDSSPSEECTHALDHPLAIIRRHAGIERQRQEDLWITHAELATGPGHPFYQRLNRFLDEEKFDEFAENECARFYADKNGRPSLTPGT